jgi:tRNA pseudouridine38-40 synthase
MTVEYDGAGFHGWQRQASDRTVQGELEKALAVLAREGISVAGSGRTDAGVHAIAQVASFRSGTHLDPETIRNALDSLTGADLVVHEVREAEPDFHARFNARGKTYEYRILNRERPSALERRYRWWVRRPLDLGAMEAALKRLRGTHDFRSFEGAGSPRSHSVRTLREAALQSDGEGRLAVRLTADGFLRYMVRNIVGTVVDVGMGQRAPGDIPDILAARDRSAAGATAPAHGLFLVHVEYEEEARP